jgi:hypothetical protein
MIQKFLHLPFTDKLLLIRAALLLLSIQVGLALFSFPRIYRWVKRQKSTRSPKTKNASATGDICWAITRVGKVFYGDEGCLIQAILGEWWLSQRGVPAKLCIGVSRQPGGPLLAHAWVESDGHVLIGGVTNQVPDGFQDFPELNKMIG